VVVVVAVVGEADVLRMASALSSSPVFLQQFHYIFLVLFLLKNDRPDGDIM